MYAITRYVTGSITTSTAVLYSHPSAVYDGEVAEAGDADGARRDAAEHQRVAELAGERRPDQPRPQVLLLGALLDQHDHPRVDGLADDEAGQPGHDQLGVGTDDVLEVLLVGVEVRGREVDRHPERQRRQDVHREAEEDRPPGGLESVHLGEHVADHVGQREDDEPAVGDDRAERDALGRGHVGDDHQRGEDRDEYRVVGRPHLSECGAAALCAEISLVTRPSNRQPSALANGGWQLVGHHGVGQRRREGDGTGEVLAGEDVAFGGRRLQRWRRSGRRAARPARRRSRWSRSRRRRSRAPKPSGRG